MMAISGTVVLIGGYYLSLYLVEINHERLNECIDHGPDEQDCPNFVYYHDGGDATLVFFLTLAIGGGLLIVSPVIAVGYWVIRR